MKTNIPTVVTSNYGAWDCGATQGNVLKVLLLVNARKIVEERKLCMSASRAGQARASGFKLFDDSVFNCAHFGICRSMNVFLITPTNLAWGDKIWGHSTMVSDPHLSRSE